MNCLKSFLCFKKKKDSNKINKEQNLTQQINKVLRDDSEIIKLDMTTMEKEKLNFFLTPFRFRNNSKQDFQNPKEKKKTNMKTIETKIIQTQNEKEKKSKIIYDLKDKLRCLFCNGIKCKHENYLNNKSSNAIKGLHSNFITDDIIASQRPSEKLITKFNLVQVFKDMNIGLIINLQREGEHPYCGPNAYNLTSSGYSYNHLIFSGNDIMCRLFGWKDMTTPSTINFMLDIVKEMTIAVKEFKKKVLVHCHAGYGRTGVVIACYLIFNSFDKNAKDIILDVRNKRKKCIENSKQEKFCYKFAHYISHIRTLFIVHSPKEKIETYLKFQEDLLFGEEELIYGIVPILIVKCLEKIMKVTHKYSLNNNQIYHIILQAYSPMKNESQNIIDLLKESINKNNWTLFDKTENLNIIVFLLFDWIKNYVSFIIDAQRINKIISNSLFPEIFTILKEKRGKILELCKLIKTSFYNYEYETLYCIALFVANYVPEKNNEDKRNYQGMIDVFSIALLGFDYNKIIKSNENENYEDTKKIVTGLSTIIEFLVLTMTFYYDIEVFENNHINMSRLSSISHSINTPTSLHLRTMRRMSKYNLIFSNLKMFTSYEENLKQKYNENNHLGLYQLDDKANIKNAYKSNSHLQDFSKKYFFNNKKDIIDISTIQPLNNNEKINTLNKVTNVTEGNILLKKSLKSVGRKSYNIYPQDNYLKNGISNISEEGSIN